MMRNLYVWFLKRIAIPVTWYASAVFLIGPAAPSVFAEFVSGAVVLVVWAVVADWPLQKD
ncbi:MAG: hypothetical protein ACLFP0_05155 [Rhodosalinus sp.]